MILSGDKLVGGVALGDVAVGVVRLGDKLIWKPITLNPLAAFFLADENGVITSTASATQGRATSRYGLGVDGLWYEFGANENVISGGRVTGSVGSRVVYGKDTEGNEYPDPPWYEHAPAAENVLPSSNNLANATYWNKTNLTATFDQVGLTGAANSATLLTATADNATVGRTAASAIGSDHAAVYYIKRVTGTGKIEISNNNLANFLDITAQVDANPGKFVKVAYRRSPSTTTPRPGIRLGTSGDQIIVGNVELYAATTPELARDLPPIFTTTAAVPHGSASCTLDISKLNSTRGAIYAEVMVGGDCSIINGFLSRVSENLVLNDQTNNDSVAMSANAWHRIGAAWSEDDDLMCLAFDGVMRDDVNFDGDILNGLFTLFASASTVGRIRNIKTYEVSGL